MAVARGLFITPDGAVGTTAVEARQNLAALLTPDGDLGVVPGVISGLTVTGVASGWTYQVTAGHAVTTRGATDGAVVLSVDGNTNTPAPVLAGGGAGSTSAPVSGSRYELIWILQRDLDDGEADNIAAIGVTQGTASGSPVRPVVPTGALVIAEALVPTGAANTAAGSVTITSVAAKVGTRGAAIPVANATQRNLLDTFATATNPVTVFRLDLGVTQSNYGAGWYTGSIGPWVTYTATLGAGWAVGTTGGASAVTRWRYEGDSIFLEYRFVQGTNGLATFTLPGATFTLPVTADATEALRTGVGIIGRAATTYHAAPRIESGGTACRITLGTAPHANVSDITPFGAWAALDVTRGHIIYKPA